MRILFEFESNLIRNIVINSTYFKVRSEKRLKKNMLPKTFCPKQKKNYSLSNHP